MSVLEITDLVITGVPSGARIVDAVSLSLETGSVLGLVGESGSGKTTLGLALLGYAKPGTCIAGGTVQVGDHLVVGGTAAETARARGRAITYIPQSPASALNPTLRLITQLRECVPSNIADPKGHLRQILAEVALPASDDFLRRYPHQLSGGQQQRVTIAMAFAARPDLIVLDEPTTGLDVSTQRHVLSTVRSLVAQHGVSAVYISHDVAVVAGLADRVAVLYSGRLAELGAAAQVVARPRHPYTRRLLQAVPDPKGQRLARGIAGGAPSPLYRPPGCAFSPRCDVAAPECSKVIPAEVEVGPSHSVWCPRSSVVAAAIAPIARFAQPTDAPIALTVRGVQAGYGSHTVLHGIDLELRRGACTALLGESGSGKTTLARAIAGLQRMTAGEVILDGTALADHTRRRSREQLRRIQYVFQNPYESINPRRSVRDALLTPYRLLCGKPEDADEVVAKALEGAALRPDIAKRYPDQLSGGERQRVAIARALAVDPDILVCDEITSSLDVSVQASIVELLQKLQAERNLTLLFVTHNMALVRNLAQDVAVLESGRIVEYDRVERVFSQPSADYTGRLIADTPDFAVALEGN